MNIAHSASPARPRGRRALGAALFAVTLTLTAGDGRGVAQEPARVDEARAALEQWVETERLIYREDRDLAIKRELLQSRIAVVQREIETTRARIAEAETQLAAAEREETELLAEAARRETSTAGLADLVAGLEARTRALVARMPAAALERLTTLLPRLPVDPAATQLGLGDRFLTVVGILNGLNKFHRELTVTSELRQLPGGAVEVSVLYLGVSQAWYVSADGAVAGVGGAGPDGWVWTPANESAAAIARALAIHAGAAEAGFVRLPLQNP
jgi:hypothetical protein